MNKLILLLILGVVVFAIMKSYARRGQQSAKQADSVKSNEDMVKCAQCGVHMPVSESLLSKGNYFCTNEHRLMHNK